MKIALVHDYIKEFGGAERVLRVLTEMFPEAPIYTAFRTPGSPAAKAFADRKVVESNWGGWLRYGNLHSPLRFLLPWIWGGLDLSEYEVVITSCSGYIARGFRVSNKTKVIAYCHTPPRFLYGYETSVDWQKYWPVKIYAVIVNHFLRQFDYVSAQRVDKWVVNSKNVAARVAKFYRKEAEIIYPPIETKLLEKASRMAIREDPPQTDVSRRAGYFLIVSRLVGAKGLLEAVKAAKSLAVKLKIVGGTAGYSSVQSEIEKLGGGVVEFLGMVSDEELVDLYVKARGFLALAREEDFGMTVVEAAAAGTPVIAFAGGGFLETVIDGETGILIDRTDVMALEGAFRRFDQIKWDKEKLQNNARRFSRDKFEKEIRRIVAVR